MSAKRDPRDESHGALLFALTPERGTATRWLAAIRKIVFHPRQALAILRSRLAGKRLRSRQAAMALLGADHRGLWRSPSGLPAAAGVSSCSAGRVAIVTAEMLRQGAVPEAGVIILIAQGHVLVERAADRLADAFAADPGVLVLYGDALFQPAGPGGRCLPLLRPAFDPEYLLAVDYVGPVIAMRREALRDVGGLADVPPGTEAMDFVLRCAEQFSRGAIRHIPHFVSFWRPRGERTEAGCAARLRTVRRLLHRTGEAGTRVEVGTEGTLSVLRPLPEPRPLVSLIVPTRDRLDLLRPCIESLQNRTDWPAREILICDNDSRDPETHVYFRELKARRLARIIACPGPFNFAAMNNAAARQGRGRLLAFINNDVEAFQPDWLERLCREALRPGIGAVGAKLLDGEGRIQHAGIVLGTGGLVTHGHRHFPGDAPGYLAGLQATREVSAVTAACLVVEAEKFAAIGGFDEKTFAVDFNDVDLCLRLNAAGYRTLLVPSAVLHHREAASRRWTPEARARHQGEVAALKKRWGPLLAQDPHYHPGFDPDLGTYARLRRDWPAGIATDPR